MRSGWLSLLCALGISAAAAANAQDAADGAPADAIATAPQAELTPVDDAKPCSPKTAGPAGFAAVVADPGAFTGKCIRLKGLLIGPALYADYDGYYLSGGRIGDPDTEGEARLHRIGVYLPSRYHLLQDAPAREVELIGKVVLCEKLPSLTIGYCHFTRGPALAVTTLTSKPFVLHRLMDDASRARVGNLVPATPRERKTVAPFAARVLADIAGGHLQDFLSLEGWTGDPDLGPGGLHKRIFKDPASPYAALRNGATPQLAVFRVTDRGMTRAAAAEHKMVFCYCRDASCKTRWPITTADAANSIDRPYLCFARVLVDGTEIVQVRDDFRAMKEPNLSSPAKR